MGSLPGKLPFSKKRLPKKVILSYILDYVIIIVLVIAFYVLDAVEPYHQQFSLRNYTLQYKYAVKERVPVPELVVYAVLCPAIIIAVYTLVIDGFFSHDAQPQAPRSSKRRSLTGRYRLKDRLWELNCGVLGLLLAVGAAFTITGTLKNAIGKPRPDLIDRCQPNVNEDPQPFGLSNSTICTQDDNAILKDGFRSFPSGHSSTAFAGLFYLSIYLAAKLHVLDSKGEVWKSFVVLIPTLGAALIAGSRIMDARHHPFDVISGSLLGILCAWGSYRQYFPPVSETWRKGRAYPIRSWGKMPQPPEIIQHPMQSASFDYHTEPLRTPSQPVDEEMGPNHSSTAALASAANDGSGGNAFRAQIAAQQRHREVHHHAPPSSRYSADVTGTDYSPHLADTNPFASAPQRLPRDYNWESSSDEDDDDTSYELQQSHHFSNQQGHGYDAVTGFNSQDTSYHGQMAGPPRFEGTSNRPTATSPGYDTHGGDLARPATAKTPPPT